MRIIDRGAGPALVLIPGIQGRWEYIGPVVDALAPAFRVITFALCDEPASDLEFDGARGFDNYVEQVRGALDRCGIDRALVCGISFGGLIALRFAAVHPDRTAALVLASTPGPGWHLRRRHEIYSRLPYALGPLFLAETPWRLRRELAAAFPERAARWRFAASQLMTLMRAPLSLSRMASRARMIGTINAAMECARITVPTLVVTGERELDHVVSVDASTGYVSLIRGSRGVVLRRTGHLGSITRPREFAAAVHEFADGCIRRAGRCGAAAPPGPQEPGLQVHHVA
jgi:pimeloyl-ACP methyl ester carboxylesterase